MLKILILKSISDENISPDAKFEKNLSSNQINNKNFASTIDQIKNITQTDELKFEKKQDTFNHKIKSINDLIDLCNEKKK